MTTSKPIATITYNTPAFLLNRLQDLVDNGTISFWIYICHKGEDDVDPTTGEVTKTDKDHIHLYLEPNKRVDTMALQRVFMEILPSDPTRPLKPQPFRNASTFDWILYNLHDVEYLTTKLEEKQYHYNADDFITCDKDFLETLVHEAYCSSSFAVNKKRLALMRDPTKIVPAIASGAIPLGMACQAKAYQSMAIEEIGLVKHLEEQEHRNELVEKAIDDMNDAQIEVYLAKKRAQENEQAHPTFKAVNKASLERAEWHKKALNKPDNAPYIPELSEDENIPF